MHANDSEELQWRVEKPRRPRAAAWCRRQSIKIIRITLAFAVLLLVLRFFPVRQVMSGSFWLWAKEWVARIDPTISSLPRVLLRDFILKRL